MTDSNHGVTQHLAVLAEAFTPYKHLTASILSLAGEPPKLRVLPNAAPDMAEDIVCVPDDELPDAVAFLYSWGDKIPGDDVRAKAAAVAYVLQVESEVSFEEVLAPTRSGDVDPRIAEFTLSFAAKERSISLVRRLTVGALLLWGLESIADQASIIISELSTNAVRESPGEQIWIRVALQNGGALLECWDPSPRIPAATTLAEPEALEGRGLYIAQMLSNEQGVTQVPGTAGKIVWALCVPGEEPK